MVYHMHVLYNQVGLLFLPLFLVMLLKCLVQIVCGVLSTQDCYSFECVHVFKYHAQTASISKNRLFVTNIMAMLSVKSNPHTVITKI